MTIEYAVFERVTTVNKKNLSKHVLECTFRYDGELILSPGQYILFQIEGEWKPFTAVVNSNSNTIKIIIKLIEGTVTNNFFKSLKIGDIHQVQVPKVNVADPISRNTVFIATGTGITPLIEIAKHALDGGGKNKIRIIFGVREESDLFYINEARELEERYDNCRVIFALSRPHETWGGFRGRVDDYINMYFDEMRDADFYVCGREEIVNSSLILLKQLGVPRNRRHKIQ